MEDEKAPTENTLDFGQLAEPGFCAITSRANSGYGRVTKHATSCTTTGHCNF